MRLDVRMRKVEKKTYTTKCVPCETPAPLADLFPDTKVLTSLISDANEFRLFISNKPFAPGEVDLALPPLPFIRSTKNLTRFGFLNSRGRRLRTSSEYPVTLVLIYNDALDKEFIAERKPIHFGISAVTKAVVEDEKQPEPTDTGVAEEEDFKDIIAWFQAQIDEKGVRGFERIYGIDAGVVSRNAKRLRHGKPLASPFRKRIVKKIEREREDELRRQHLAEAEAEAERTRQEDAAREKAARDAAKRQESAKSAREKADCDAAKREESAKSARDAAERHTKATAAHIKVVLQKREWERPARPEMPGGFEQLASLEESSACKSINSWLDPDAQNYLKLLKMQSVLPAARSAIGRTLLKWGEIGGAAALIALAFLLVISFFLALVGSLLTVVIASIILGVIKVMELL